MELNGLFALACLEEDNPQRGHFRVRPLLTGRGPLTQEDIQQYRDDGYIRIVPDKKEQHTFKERMRRLGGLCVLDLRSSPRDNGKLRPNKNYSPAKGEKNRFIIYSNAVTDLNQEIFFEVLADSRVQEAATPLVYARKGGRIHGPVDRLSGLDQPTARPLPPDDARLFSVTMPDGTSRLFYWPEEETKAPALPEGREEKAEAEAAPVTAAPEPEKEPAEETQEEPMNALDRIRALNGRMVASMKGEDGEKEQPEPVVISQVGTPLYHAVLPPAQKAEAPVNALSQAVENSRRTMEKTAEADPAQPGEAPEEGQPEKAKKAKAPRAEKKPRKTAEAAALPEKAPAPAPSATGTDLIRAQIQDMEAERLMTVMNLERAKADAENYRREVLESAEAAFREKAAQAQARLTELQEQISAAKAERDEAERRAGECAQSDPFALRRRPAQTVPAAQVRDRLCQAMRERGLSHDPETAAALLLCWAVSDERALAVRTDSPADVRTLAEALAAALGAPFSPHADTLKGYGESAAVTLSALRPKDDGLTTVTDAKGGFFEEGLFFCPVVPVKQSGEEPEAKESVFSAADEAALRRELQDKGTALSAEASAMIAQIRALCKNAGETLPLCAVRGLKRFLMAGQNLFPGGMQTAMDWGVLCYVLPLLGGEARKSLMPLLAACPRCRAYQEKQA